MNKTLIIGGVVGGIVVAGLVASLLYFFAGSTLGVAETSPQHTQETTSPEETLQNNLTPEQERQERLKKVRGIKETVLDKLTSLKEDGAQYDPQQVKTFISTNIATTKKNIKKINND